MISLPKSAIVLTFIEQNTNQKPAVTCWSDFNLFWALDPAPTNWEEVPGGILDKLLVTKDLDRYYTTMDNRGYFEVLFERRNLSDFLQVGVPPSWRVNSLLHCPKDAHQPGAFPSRLGMTVSSHEPHLPRQGEEEDASCSGSI